jgi:hypothetical protein
MVVRRVAVWSHFSGWSLNFLMSTGARVFCGNCGSAIALSAAFGGALVIQTGNFADFAHVPVTTECEWVATGFHDFLQFAFRGDFITDCAFPSVRQGPLEWASAHFRRSPGADHGLIQPCRTICNR